MAAAKALVQETGHFMANRAADADKATAALEQAKDQGASDSILKQLTAAKADADKWTPGGEYGRAMTVLQVAVGGNVTGGMSGLLQNATVSYLQSIGAEKIKAIADSFQEKKGTEDATSGTLRAALHAIASCAGAAATSSNCSSAAVGAASSVVINNVLSEIESTNADKMTASEKEKRKNLVGSLIAGIAEATGGNAAAANNAAQIEMENNYLNPTQIEEKSKALASAKSPDERKKIQDEYDLISKNQNQTALKKLMAQELAVMTPVEYSQLSLELKQLAASPACDAGCKADASHGFATLDDYLSRYRKADEQKKLQPLVDDVGNIILMLLPVNRVMGVLKSPSTLISVLKEEAFAAKFNFAYKKAPEAKLEVDLIADKIAETFGGRVAKSPIKSKERAIYKIENDYFGDVSKIKDLARNTIIIDSDQISRVTSDLIKNGANVKIVNGADDLLGYSGVNATVKTKSGIFAEIQVNSPEMIFAKEPEALARGLLGDRLYDSISATSGVPGGLGHKFYERWRVLDQNSSEAKIIQKQSKAYYEAIRSKNGH
ncbi:VENN motif pre-toxin domain-containing protein [Iodobacter fluviatilis]|uniref:VENN motif-containing domain-containing protein n=1 Tax=Iodobacter fluviatilis TaxID=537 RepID=A0A377Q754_9NEIS|nr:VENN motif pre-toxin domain-containing protein [Iodobacter fluviatilis]TCU88822.1 hypothetical protein EV682_103406 [Iodobacter fluviatilis]STQ91106.1 Uncharacterised protein [Iodobacter fluviatilis]